MAAIISSSASASASALRTGQQQSDVGEQIKDDDDGGQTRANTDSLATNIIDNMKQPQQQVATGDKSSPGDQPNSAGGSVIYDVEHLATFSAAASASNGGNKPIRDRKDRANEKGRRPVPVGGTRLSSRALEAAVGPAEANIAEQQQQQQQQQPQVADATEPRVALQRLFELEKLSGIWTQRMQIELRDDLMLIVDCETNAIVERFHRNTVTKPEAFSEYNDIYSNIIVFIIQQQDESTPSNSNSNNSNNNSPVQTTIASDNELHIFQCVSHKAQQLVADILAWKSASSTGQSSEAGSPGSGPEEAKPSSPLTDMDKNKEAADIAGAANEDCKKQEAAKSKIEDSNAMTSQKPPGERPVAAAAAAAGQPGKPLVVTMASSSSSSETVPIVNVNVKETVQVFNQIAALREKGRASSPTTNTIAAATSGSGQPARPLSDASQSSSSSSTAANGAGQLSSTGQLYKQRSIRAVLAPKTASDGAQPGPTSGQPTQKQQQQQQPASSSAASSSSSSFSSSSMTSSSETAALQTTNSSSDIKTSQQRPSSSSKSPPSKSTSSHNNHNHQHQQPPVPPPATQYPNGNSNSNSKSSKSRLTNGNNSFQQQQQQQQHHHQHQQQTSSTSSSSTRMHDSPPMPLSQQQLEQVTTNESYVSVLNHCFDDIEKFILRLQHAAAALRELQTKRKLSKRSSSLASASSLSTTHLGHLNGHLNAHGHALHQQQLQHQSMGNKLLAGHQAGAMSASEMAHLSARARGPTEVEYFDIFCKFKLAFNLLAKLKGCIHDPNAPELVHFLFTPLAIIIESARNVSPPIDPALTLVPYLNKDALELLSNCCTSKESDMWLSLGPNWTQTCDINQIKKDSIPGSFQPIFSDGWAPIIAELELIGLVRLSASSTSTSSATTTSTTTTTTSNSNSNGEPSVNTTSLAPIDDGDYYQHHNNRRSSQYDGEPAGEPMASNGHGDQFADGPQYGAPARNGRLAGGQEVAAAHRTGTGHASSRALKKRSSPPEGVFGGQHYGAAGYFQEPPLETDETDDPHSGAGYRVPGHSASRFMATGAMMPPSGRPKSSSRRSSQPSLRPHNHLHHQQLHHEQPFASMGAPMGDMGLVMDARYQAPVNGGDLLPSDDYTELHGTASAVDYYGAPPLPPTMSGHYGRPRHLQPPRYSLPTDHMGRMPARRGTATKNNGKLSYLGPSHPFPAHLDQHQPAMGGTYDQPTGGFVSGAVDEAERQAMLLDLGPAQTDWLLELQARQALIVRVLFTREANNDKELSVRQGEILEVLDDSRKWWKARNIDQQVAHVPHTIVAVIEHYQTLDELLLLTSSPPAGGLNDADDHHHQQQQQHQFQHKIHQQRMSSSSSSRQFQNTSHLMPQLSDGYNYNYAAAAAVAAQAGPRGKDTKRNSKTAGAFRYF